MEVKDISLSQFDELCKELFDIREEKEEHEKIGKTIEARYRAAERKVLEHMANSDRTSYSLGMGQVIKTTRFSVSMPKDLEKKKAFFGWLREKGVFEEIVTVNHQSLNALYKDALEGAARDGDIDVVIPGLGEPTAMEYVTLRRKK